MTKQSLVFLILHLVSMGFSQHTPKTFSYKNVFITIRHIKTAPTITPDGDISFYIFNQPSGKFKTQLNFNFKNTADFNVTKLMDSESNLLSVYNDALNRFNQNEKVFIYMPVYDEKNFYTYFENFTMYAVETLLSTINNHKAPPSIHFHLLFKEHQEFKKAYTYLKETSHEVISTQKLQKPSPPHPQVFSYQDALNIYEYALEKDFPLEDIQTWLNFIKINSPTLHQLLLQETKAGENLNIVLFKQILNAQTTYQLQKYFPQIPIQNKEFCDTYSKKNPVERFQMLKTYVKNISRGSLIPRISSKK